MTSYEQNLYGGVHPRRSIRVAERLSHSPHSKSTDRSGTYDTSSDESDSFDYSSNQTSLNSSRREENVHQHLHSTAFPYKISRERYDELVNDMNAKPKPQSKSKPKSSDSGTIYYVVFVIFAILAVTGGYLYKSSPQFQESTIQCPQFKELEKQFSRQEQRLWKSLKVGIENMLNKRPPQPNVFLFAYNDAETSKNVMASILNVTASCMQSEDLIKLHGGTFVTDLMLKDYGVFIDNYRKPLEREGIMYVADLQEIPGQVAQAFHTICDTVTPFVERSIIYFTLHVDQYDEKMRPQQLLQLVESKLEHIWSDINKDTRKALIGRVTDQTFLLHSENGNQ